MVAGTARNIHPARLAAIHAHDTHSYSGVCGTNEWIRESPHGGIRGGPGIYKGKITDTGGIELPVGNGLPIGAPVKPIADIELFLRGPGGRFIDSTCRTIHY